ncbi:MAG: hypothetical protein GY866_28135 [Proteobacteria bacterium]|nr:hypothetical protein [Pseudomonadota bacterium]
MSRLYSLHGMESSPQGTKSQLLRRYFPECVIPELPPDIDQRMEILRDLITEPAWLVGSSLGGLSALLFAMEKPGLVEGMVILAPAVGTFDSEFFSQRNFQRIRKTYVPTGIPCTVIAGEYDTVIPMEDIEKMVERSPDKERITMIKVEDDHSLNRSLDLLLECITKMVGTRLSEIGYRP